MTTGNVLYLLMSIGAFAVFAAVLAYESWQQSRFGQGVIPTPVPSEGDEPQDALPA